MGLSISKLLSGLFGKKEMRILMVGLVGHPCTASAVRFRCSSRPCELCFTRARELGWNRGRDHE